MGLEELVERMMEEARIDNERYVEENGATMELVNATPALVGSWLGLSINDPEALTVEPPRPTDIAGKTRWWLRSILASAIWEETGKTPSLKKLDKITTRIMGSTEEASRIMLRIEPLARPRYIGCSTIDRRRKESYAELCIPGDKPVTLHIPSETCKSPRVVLQMLGKDKHPLDILGTCPLPPCTYRFKLTAIPRPGAKLNELEERLAGYALALALFATGIGRNVTRGYGKLAPINGIQGIKGKSILADAIREAYELIRRGDLETLADKATSTAINYIKNDNHIKDLLTRRIGLIIYIFNSKYISTKIHNISTNIYNLINVINKSVNSNNNSNLNDFPLTLEIYLGLRRRHHKENSDRSDKCDTAIAQSPELFLKYFKIFNSNSIKRVQSRIIFIPLSYHNICNIKADNYLRLIITGFRLKENDPCLETIINVLSGYIINELNR